MWTYGMPSQRVLLCSSQENISYPFTLFIREDAALSTCCEVTVHFESVSGAALVRINPVFTWKQRNKGHRKLYVLLIFSNNTHLIQGCGSDYLNYIFYYINCVCHYAFNLNLQMKIIIRQILIRIANRQKMYGKFSEALQNFWKPSRILLKLTFPEIFTEKSAALLYLHLCI